MEMARLRGRTQETLESLRSTIDSAASDSQALTRKIERAQGDAANVEQLLGELKNDKNVATIEAISKFFTDEPDNAKSLASISNEITMMVRHTSELRHDFHSKITDLNKKVRDIEQKQYTLRKENNAELSPDFFSSPFDPPSKKNKTQ